MNLTSDLGLCDLLRLFLSFMLNGVSSGHGHNLGHVTRQGQFICVFLKVLQ